MKNKNQELVNKIKKIIKSEYYKSKTYAKLNTKIASLEINQGIIFEQIKLINKRLKENGR